MANKITFASNINIGQNGAEVDDNFLFKCFVDHEALHQLRDIESSAMFAVGSTGIGKTAILRMIEKNEANCSSLELQEMAMDRLANSDTVNFLEALDVDLSIFFQTLWKHVLCVEYIKMISAAKDEDKFRFWKSKFVETLFGNKAKERLDHFLEKHAHQFWNTIDENIIEYTTALEKNVNAELGGEVEKFQGRAGYARSLSAEKRVQLQQRARKFVNSETISQLGQVISLLAEYTRDRPEKYFIIIDKIDENWISETLKFRMVAALFEALKGFQKLRNFKVVVALRSDNYERMKAESSPSRQQLEKYEDYIVRIRWSKEKFRQIAERRINHLFRWQYSSNHVNFDDIYGTAVVGKEHAWKYMAERTLYRPRDIINFINLTLQAAEGKSSVSKNDFRTGEANYSNIRLEALLHEWSSTYPAIPALIDLLHRKPSYFEFDSFASSTLEERLFEKIGADEAYQSDPLWKMIENSVAGSSPKSASDYAGEILHRLHLIGAVGLKLDPNSSWQWFHETSRTVAPRAISKTSKISVHPMLRLALRNLDESVAR